MSVAPKTIRLLNGLVIPDCVASDIGLGCPRHDDHELVSIVAIAGDVRTNEVLQRFIRRHSDCGILEQLEVKGGVLGVTGVLDPKGSS